MVTRPEKYRIVSLQKHFVLQLNRKYLSIKTFLKLCIIKYNKRADIYSADCKMQHSQYDIVNLYQDKLPFGVFTLSKIYGEKYKEFIKSE